MKKRIPVILLAISMLVLPSCGKNESLELFPKEPYIEAMTLAPQEQELVNLFQNSGSVSISRFSLNCKFKNVSIILYVYQNGKLIDTKSTGADNLTASDGKIAVMTDTATGFHVSLSIGGSIAKWTLSSDHDVAGLNMSALFQMPNRTTIKDKEEYPLYARFFTSSSESRISTDMLNNPEKTRDFDYAYIIKCSFASAA